MKVTEQDWRDNPEHLLYSVYFNGLIHGYILEASEEEGYIIAYDIRKDGCSRDSSNNPATIKKYGKVEFLKYPNALCPNCGNYYIREKDQYSFYVLDEFGREISINRYFCSEECSNNYRAKKGEYSDK